MLRVVILALFLILGERGLMCSINYYINCTFYFITLKTLVSIPSY